MSQKRIMLVESGHFIGGVIHSLFERQNEMRVIETTPTNTRELIRAVELHKPEIIVLDDTVHANYLAQLLSYMRNSEDFRVLVVNTDRNRVSVYQKQQVDVNQSADFFALL